MHDIPVGPTQITIGVSTHFTFTKINDMFYFCRDRPNSTCKHCIRYTDSYGYPFKKSMKDVYVTM